MPRIYKCRKCGEPHSPPTGKHCRQALHNEPSVQETHDDTIMSMLRDLTKRMDDFDKGASDKDSASAVGIASIDGDFSPQRSPPQRSPPREIDVDSEVPTDITPTSLRQNAPVMRRAADRLAQIRWQDEDGEELTDNTRSKNGGKKSGSMLVATKTVQDRIDWPHLYVTRMAAGRRKGVAYSELTESEFVFGFIVMIQSPRCCWDNATMQTVLHIIMQHSMEFSWENARALYDEMGVEVERRTTEWSDIDKLRDLRFSHSRARTAERKEATDSSRPPLKVAPAGTKACVAYQTRACDQTRDHPPFAHTCAYCLKTCNAICKHPEVDCIRRVTDAAKNGKKRE